MRRHFASLLSTANVHRSIAIAYQAISAVSKCRRPATLQLRPWKADVNDQPIRAWRELATDWRVWLSLALSLLIATVAWLLGYD